MQPRALQRLAAGLVHDEWKCIEVEEECHRVVDWLLFNINDLGEGGNCVVAQRADRAKPAGAEN